MVTSSEEIRFIYHASHHKCGTHWLKNILCKVADRFGLKWYSAEECHQPLNGGILFDQQSNLNPCKWSHFRGSHMIRDPRDVVVSGYFYHLWTQEDWARQPKDEFDGKSYQQHLQSLSQEDGLIAEIKKCGFVFRKIREWNYANPAICELKYEDLFAEPDTQFRRLFSHYGFDESAVEVALQLAKSCGFEAVTGRRPGAVRERTVTRSGNPGQWTEYFSPRVKARFIESVPGLLQQLAYANSDEW